MKGRFRKISFCLAVGLLLGGIVLGAYKDEGYHFPEVKPSSCEETTDLSEKSIVADETFVRKKH